MEQNYGTTRGDPNHLYYKYTFDETPKKILISERVSKRKRTTVLPSELPTSLGSKPWPLSEAKFQDLNYLCKGNTKQYHFFNSNLSYEGGK